jgi:hypothetical protein
MMKKSANIFAILSFAMLFLSSSVSAQNQVQVTGQVKDLESKESLPYCKVVALAANDSIVSGGITDDKGYFRLPLGPGQYKLVVSFYGYDSDTIQTGPLRADKFVGVIKLKPNALNLDEMNVEASSRIDYLDKDVQIITDKEKQGATAAKDVLDKVAGISYDDYAGVLKVDNDANIMILVNGVEKSQEYVQNLEPDRLLRVETTRDPGGRYGLEGYTAIVNLILRDDYKGTEVYIEQMQLVDINAEHNNLDYMIGSIGGTFNYTRNNLNIYAGAWLQRRKFKISTDSKTEYDDGYVVNENSTWREPNAIIHQYDANYTLGFDYRINPKHLISFESNISALPSNLDETDINNQTTVYSNDTLLESYAFEAKTSTRTVNIYNTLFYIADFNARNKLNVNFTHSYYEDDYSTNTAQEFYYDRSETGVNNKQYTRFYAEWDHTFSAKTSLQVGYGNTWRELKNEYTVDHRDVPTGTSFVGTSDFTLTDTRHKLYSNFSWKLNAKWGMRVGIAAESSSPRAAGQKLDYMIYQPMFDLRYVASKYLNFTLKYRTSSAYPSIAETNPFVSQVNPRITSTGNPYLRPSTTHRFSLRMNILQGMLSLEPYSHYSNNSVARVGELGADDIFNFRYENTELYQRNGVKLNFSKFFKFSMMVQANVEVFNSKIVSTSKENSFTDWRGDVDLIYIFKKTQTLLGLKYQRQQVKMISGLGYDKGEVDFWMLFYKQPLFKQRASIMFGYFLPIDFGVNYNQDSHVETTGFTMHTDNDVSLVKNMFLLEFSYRFNKGKRVKKREKDVQQESEEGAGGLF